MTTTETRRRSVDGRCSVIKDITGAQQANVAKRKIIEVCIYPMINEAVKTRGKTRRSARLTSMWSWLNGYGCPPTKVAPMFYGDMVGAQAVLDVMEKLGEMTPEFCQRSCCAIWPQMAESSLKSTEG